MERGVPQDGASQASSVGAALAAGQGYSANHPYYRMMVDGIVNKVNELSARKGLSRASAKTVALTVALNSDETQELSKSFPEFNFINYGSGRPGHAQWVQFRRLANEWLMVQARKYGGSVAHLGGSVLSYLLSDFEDASLLSDLTSAAAAHERHTASMDAFRIFQNYAQVMQQVSSTDARTKYEAYIRKEKFRTTPSHMKIPKADVLCIDCSMYAYAPLQVAAMMMQAQSSVAFGCFVYSPYMLLRDSGEIPGTGVFFDKTPSGLALHYPEGQAGVLRYSAGVWESWLTSQVFPVGVGKSAKWFQLELLHGRGHLMFFRMTALPCKPEKLVVHHALEIEDAESKYLINSWKLKRLGVDPTVEKNWENESFVAPRRLVDRVYQFAMQLENVNFTRYAIRKQIHVTNDRVTVEGTSVHVNSPLGVDLVDALVVSIYSRAFVDRYESGQLTREMMDVVKTMATFQSTSWVKRTWMIMRMCALTAWDYTFGYINDALRKFSDWVRDIVSRNAIKLAATIGEVPPYVLLSDSAVKWIGKLGADNLVDSARRSIYAANVSKAGFCGAWAEAFSRMGKTDDVAVPVQLHRFRVEEVFLHEPQVVNTPEVSRFVSTVRGLNPIAEESDDRHLVDATVAVRQAHAGRAIDFNPDADPVFTLNEFYNKVCPGVAMQNLEYDSASISLDPQDRTLAASYLRLPTYFGEGPKPRSLYQSKLKALNVPKRQGTLQELLSSMAARNLNAPQISLPQEEDQIIRTIWENFVSEACVSDAKDKLKMYQRMPVELTEQGLSEWARQATPAKLRMAQQELETNSKSLGEMPVGEYIAMLKADVKPTLSTKPLESRTEPQVIVYHEKALSALYSSMYRMLVKRFLSLLKPNYHVNLLKDTRDIEQFIAGIHPFHSAVKYLENDFSKYDKSQGRFVFKLEEYVFRQLGLDEDMLSQWVQGHVDCSIRSVALGLSLHVMYQRKSGDATTAFGNVLLNILSVSYAYRGTKVLWAVFMGDDSLICAEQVAHSDTAVDVLAEVFNLGAKTYQSDTPYYASNFVLIDDLNESVALVPDPVKRVEKWSMMISGDDPQWRERWVSAGDSMQSYLSCFKTAGLSRAISQRYPIRFEDVGDVASAVATVVSDESKFRSMWENEPRVSLY